MTNCGDHAHIHPEIPQMPSKNHCGSLSWNAVQLSSIYVRGVVLGLWVEWPGMCAASKGCIGKVCRRLELWEVHIFDLSADIANGGYVWVFLLVIQLWGTRKGLMKPGGFTTSSKTALASYWIKVELKISTLKYQRLYGILSEKCPP